MTHCHQNWHIDRDPGCTFTFSLTSPGRANDIFVDLTVG
jgi:hypothetical protein